MEIALAFAAVTYVYYLYLLHRQDNLAADDTAPKPAVNIGGRWHELPPADVLAYTFLLRVADEIKAAEERRGPPVRLMRLRDEFRCTIAACPLLGLVHVMQSAPPAAQQIAVWLAGRCDDPSIAQFIVTWSRGKKPPLRKEADRALRRLGAVQRVRPLAERLARYRGVEPEELLHATPGPKSQMDFVSNVTLGKRYSPKAGDYIRRILMHIRSLLRSTRDAGGTNHLSP